MLHVVSPIFVNPSKRFEICKAHPIASMTSSRRGIAARSLSCSSAEQSSAEQSSAAVSKGQNDTMKYLTLSGKQRAKKSVLADMRLRAVPMAQATRRRVSASSSSLLLRES